MLFVLNKQERIVNIFNNAVRNGNIFYNDKLVRDLVTGANTYTFTTLYNEKNSKTLEIGNYIAFNDEKTNEYLLFQILNIEENHGETFEITVYCECAGLSLINSILRKVTIPSCDIKKLLTIALEDTEWNVGFVDMALTDVYDLALDTSSVYSILQNNAKKYNAELNFRCVIENGKISKKYVDAFKTRGRETGKRFEFGKNIQGLKRTIDSSELYTALIGVGKNDISFKDISLPEIPNKPVGQDFVYDQDSFNRYNNKGYHIMGVFKFDTDNPQELLRKTYLKLQEVKKPHITYEVNIELLGADVQIGDTVNIIDNYFNPPLLLQARVNQLTTSLTNPTENNCVLANFVEVDSGITVQLLEQVKGVVDNSINSKFPIGTEDIKDKAITGKKIIENSISTDHLMADTVTADKIQSNSIKSKHIQARQINASHIAVGTITAENMETHTITAESGIIADATIGTMQLQDGAITNAKIGKLAVGDANIINASISDAKIKSLDASKIVSGDISGDRIKANVIDAINSNIGTALIKSAKIEDLDASKIVTGFLNADIIKAGSISGDKLEINSISGDKLEVNSIDTSKIIAGAITGDKLAINSIDAKNLKADSITNDKILSNSITGDKLQANSIDASKIKAGIITTEKLDAETINALKMGAKDLVVENIESGNIKVSNINILDGSISGTKISKASITNAQIDGAFVADAYIKNISADKITGGTFDAKNITVKNLSADSITVGRINGNQIQAGAISQDKLDQNLNGVIKNTIDNVDGALKDIGLVKQNIQDINTTVSTKVDATQVKQSIDDSIGVINKNLTDKINSSLTDAKTYTDNTGKSLANKITNVTTIVNSKNTTFYSPTQPPIDGRVNNDIWFDINHGYKMYKFTDGSWIATQFGSDALAVNSITSDKIMASAITSGKIASGSITSDKIYALAITSDKIASNSITAGKIDVNAVTSANIVAGAISTDKLGANSITSDKLNVDQLFVGDNAFISKLKALEIDASNITTGTISGDRIDINGLVGFNSLDKNLQGMFNNKNDKTYINGGMIETGTINADAINVKGNLFIQNDKGETTFSVADDGNITVNGLLESANFEKDKEGYKISTDGHAEFNDVKIRGDVILPNAGMTNYGNITDEVNLLLNSGDFRSLDNWSFTGGNNCLSIEGNILKCTFKNYAGWGAFLKNSTLKNTPFDVNAKYTIVVRLKASRNQSVGCQIIDGDGHNCVVTKDLNLTTEWQTFNFTFKPSQAGNERQFRFLTGNLGYTFDLYVDFCKVIKSDKASNQWCPSPKDNINFVRFFAGSSFDNRNNAPFRVMQDGSMFATNGTFAGRIIGHYDSGKVHIKDDEIIINNKSVNVANGTIVTNDEDFSHPFLKFSPNQSIINTNLVLGSLDDKKLEFLNSERVLNLYNGGLNLLGKFKNINIGKETDSEHHILSLNSVFGGQHNIKYLDNEGGLTFEALGSNNATTPYDFNFTRPDGNTIVKVDGSIDVAKSIKAQNNNIEMQFKEDGWGFYAI